MGGIGSRGVWGSVLGAAVLGAALFAAPGQAAEPYYAGKTIEIIVPFSAGGGTDVWTRFVATYLARHVPGSPRVVVRNIPGGESITGANSFVTTAKPDGLTLLASSATTVFHYLLGRPQVKYDFARLEPVVVSPTGAVIYGSPQAGVRSVEDLRDSDVRLVYGGISATGLDLTTLLSFELLDLDVKAVLGFEGRGPARLAFERGETTVDYQTTSAYQSQVEPLVEEGKVTPLMTFGLLAGRGVVERDPTFPDLPTVPEVYRHLFGKDPSGEVWRAYLAFMAAGYAYQKVLWAPTGTREEALDALYQGAQRLVEDPEFREKAKGLIGNYPTFVGRDVEETLRDALTLPDAVRKFARDFVTTNYGVRF